MKELELIVKFWVFSEKPLLKNTIKVYQQKLIVNIWTVNTSDSDAITLAEAAEGEEGSEEGRGRAVRRPASGDYWLVSSDYKIRRFYSCAVREDNLVQSHESSSFHDLYPQVPFFSTLFFSIFPAEIMISIVRNQITTVTGWCWRGKT